MTMSTGVPVLMFLDFPPEDSRVGNRIGPRQPWIDAIYPRFLTDHPEHATHIVVFGGDGSMLHAIAAYQELGVPFFGVNFGTIGFLMNQIQDGNHLLETLGHGSELVEVSMMRAIFSSEHESGTTIRSAHAFNDVYFNANPGSMCRGWIEGNRYPRHEFAGDGLIIATPQGSTAYNRNAGGSVLPLRSGLFAVTTICPQSRPIHDVIEAQQLRIRIENSKPVTAHADSNRFDQVSEIVLTPNERKVRLAFAKGSDFQARRYAQGGWR